MTTFASIPVSNSSASNFSAPPPPEPVFMTLFLLESSRQMLSAGQSSAQPSSYLRQHLPSELSVSGYWENLPEADKEKLRGYWGELGLNCLRTIAREDDTELYLEAILHLGQTLIKKDRLAPALFLFELVARRGERTFPNLAAQARNERDAVAGPLNPLVGRIDWGRRLEFMSGQVGKQLLDPALIAGMFVDQWGFFTGRGFTLLKLLKPSAVKIPWRVRAASNLAGFALEAPLYAAAHRGVNYLLDRPGNYGSLGDEILGIWTLRGGMAVGGFLGNKVGRTILRWSPLVEGSTYLGRFGGIVLGNGIGAMTELRKPTNLDGLLLDSFVTSLHYYGLRGVAARRTPLPF